MESGKTERFGMVMNPIDRHFLEFIKRRERISAAAVVRRLIWREAQQMGCEFPDASDESVSTETEAMPHGHV